MQFFKSVQIAEYCFISEAVEFLALGRVPEYLWTGIPEVDADGNVSGPDGRFHWKEMPDNFEPSDIPFEHFELQEFDLAGIEKDEEYFKAVESVLNGKLSDAKSTIEVWGENLGKYNLDDETMKDIRSDLEAARKTVETEGYLEKIFHQTNDKFSIHLEKAWGIIFALVQSEILTVEAVDLNRWEKMVDEDGDYMEAGEFVDVSPLAFRIGHDFKQNTVEFEGTSYVATRVRTEGLFNSVRSNAAFAPQCLAQKFGQCLIMEAGTPQALRRRGAPNAVDWVIVAQHLQSLVSSGALPVKKESGIQELIDFSIAKFGRRLGRSTIQFRLKEQLNEAYARKAE